MNSSCQKVPSYLDRRTYSEQQLWDRIRALSQYQVPSVRTALMFICYAVMYTIFTLILTVTVLRERLTDVSHEFVRTVTQGLVQPELADVSDMKSAFEYITDHVCPEYASGYLSWNGKIRKQRKYPRFQQQSVALTPLRLRQHRVKPQERNDWFKFFGPRIPPATREDYSTDLFETLKGTVFGYQTRIDSCRYKDRLFTLCDEIVEGNVPGSSYPGGGYAWDLHSNVLLEGLTKLEDATGTIERKDIVDLCRSLMAWIEDEEWIDEKTRVLFVEFSLMNTNRKDILFGMPTLLFEFPAEGGVETRFDIIPFRAKSAITSLEWALIAYIVSMVILAVTVVVYRFFHPTPCICCVIKRCNRVIRGKAWFTCEMCRDRFDRNVHKLACPSCGEGLFQLEHVCIQHGYFLNGMIWLKILTVLLIVVTFIIQHSVNLAFLSRSQALEEFTNAIDPDPTVFLGFSPLQSKMTIAYALHALSLVLAYLGLYNVLRHFEIVAKFLRLFEHGSALILTFIMSFSIVFFGFSLAFHVVLGVRTEGFRTLTDSIMNTFRLLLADIPFSELLGESYWLAAMLYVMYGIMCTIVALNVFIAIITASYEQAIVKQPPTRIYLSLQLLWYILFLTIGEGKTKKKKRAETDQTLDISSSTQETTQIEQTFESLGEYSILGKVETIS